MSAVLTLDRLEQARIAQLRALPDRARLLRHSAGERVRATTTYSWVPVALERPLWAPRELWPATLAGAVPARVSAPGRAELVLGADRWGANPVWVITLPYGTPVVAGDRIELEQEGVTWQAQVLGDYTAGRSWQTVTRLGAGDPA